METGADYLTICEFTVRDHSQITITKVVAFEFGNPPVTGNGHGRVSSPTGYLVEVVGAQAAGPIRRGMTL